MKRLLLAGATLVATLALAFVADTVFHRVAPEPSSGTLDLRSWDFSRSGSVSLGGTWSFLPEQRVGAEEFGRSAQVIPRHIPDTRFGIRGGFFQGTGSGTYRLVVLLPPGMTGLGVRYSTVWTGFEAEANGAVIVQQGTSDQTPGLPAPWVVAGTAALPQGDRIELLVRVVNRDYRWGGIVQPFVLGNLRSLTSQQTWDDLMAFLLMGVVVGVAANSLFLFAFRRQDFVYLFFSAFAFMVALRALTSGDNLLAVLFPGIGTEAFVRVQYTSLYFLLPTAALFFWRLFPEDISRREITFLLVLPGAFCLLVPFAPLIVLSWSLLPYFLVAIAVMAYGYVAACWRPASRDRPGADIVLVAGTVLVAAVLYNFHDEVVLAHAESIFPLGLVAFVLVQALVMAKRFTWAFQTAETLGTELKKAYGSLMVEARAAEEARDGLAVVLGEKETLLREVHHRVKNSLQIILSITNLQVRRTKDPGALAAYRSMRDRIRAISSVHSRLYGLESETRVDLQEYVQDLIRSFEDGYEETTTRFEIEAAPLLVPMDFCLEVGLVLTELVLNAYRFAVLPSGGSIRIVLRTGEDSLHLRVSDDGPGFPPGFEPREVKTVGYRIVLSMVEKRRGSLEVFPGPGAAVEVVLPFGSFTPVEKADRPPPGIPKIGILGDGP